MTSYELVIRRGTILDGSGGAPFTGDVAIDGGVIVAVGEVAGTGKQEIDAAGLLVTPGFVDIHTHYDGQVTWENRTLPSAAHGVTTVVMGNCGVGFAPCRPSDREKLIALMEGVEDIPEVVMSDGLPWTWETFPEYLDVVAARAHDVDVAAQLPHSCLRVYVMGQRGLDRAAATPDEIAEMARLTEEAMHAGAIGFATSRSVFHRDRNGLPIPSKDVGEAELHAIAGGMTAAGHGVIEALIDFDDNMDSEFGLLRRVVEKSGRPLSFTVTQILDHPDCWRQMLGLIDEAQADGVPMKGQVIGRPTGMMLGLNLSFNPFSLAASYQAIAGLPLAEKVAEMRKPEVRARILSERPDGAKYKMLDYLERFDRIFDLGDPPDYAPPADASVAAIAARRGVDPREVAYDLLLERDGNAILFLPIGNYAECTLDPVLGMLTHEHTLLGLGDGGAHYGVICDAGYPTFMLTYWTRDRVGERLALPQVIRALASDPAEAVGLADRGRVAPGYKADLNIIDYDRLHLHAPRVMFDLPAGGRRMVQDADGYVATIVSGEVTYREGQPTGALPGKLVRGPQHCATIARDAGPEAKPADSLTC